MTDRPIIFSAPMALALLAGRKTMTHRLAWNLHRGEADGGRPSPWQRVQPGWRLWVREAWRIDGAGSSVSANACRGHRSIEYRADGYAPIPHAERSPSHMPRWASRLTLTVTAVKVEPLQAITDREAQAEGIHPLPQQSADDLSAWWESGPGKHQARAASGSFRLLWNSLHGDDAWTVNPEVVVLTFTVAQRNIDDPKRDGGAG